jgi:hypothetical protein
LPCPDFTQVVDGDDCCVSGEDRGGEEGVGVRIGVSGGVFEDHDPVVTVHRFADGDVLRLRAEAGVDVTAWRIGV